MFFLAVESLLEFHRIFEFVQSFGPFVGQHGKILFDLLSFLFVDAIDVLGYETVNVSSIEDGSDDMSCFRLSVFFTFISN